MTYQPVASMSFPATIASAASVGTNTVTLNSAKLFSVSVGDVIKINPYSAVYKATNNVAASNGVLAGVTFTPNMTGSAPANAIVSVSKALSMTVKAMVSRFDQTPALATDLITVTSVKVIIDQRSLSVPNTSIRPIVGDRIIMIGGRVLLVDAVSQDGAGAFWIIQAH
ncbi:MAG: hypothetical protein WCJ64_05750 [Rhodospirillaceae bacterium]